MGRWIGIGLAVVAAIAIAFITAAVIFPGFRETSRDIAIILLALFQMIGAILSIAILAAIYYAVYSINRLAQSSVIPRIETISEKVDQVLDTTRVIAGNVQETTATVTGTTEYVAEKVVNPIIRVSSLLAGVRGAARFLAERGMKD